MATSDKMDGLRMVCRGAGVWVMPSSLYLNTAVTSDRISGCLGPVPELLPFSNKLGGPQGPGASTVRALAKTFPFELVRGKVQARPY